MKIIHVSLCSYPYISTWGYQENHMINVHHRYNHEVVEISTGYVPFFLKSYINVKESRLADNNYVDDYGTHIYRLTYKYQIPEFINSRIRLYRGLYDILEEEQPDLIFVHDIQFFSLLDIVKYIKNHEECVLKCDLHADYENSGKSIISQTLLHKIVYRYLIRKCIKYFKNIYYLMPSCLIFFRDMYGINTLDSRFEFLPLGGVPVSKMEKLTQKKKNREWLKIPFDDIVILHSGKLDEKKRTDILIKAFLKTNIEKIHLIIVGSIPSENKQLGELIKLDKRIKYLGWKSSEELIGLLCAADIYAQPGSQSSTLNTSICCGCIPIVNLNADRPGNGYSCFLNDSNSYPVVTEEDIVEAINSYYYDTFKRDSIQKNSALLCNHLLNYNEQIRRIIN